MRGLLTTIILLWNFCLPLLLTGQDLSGNIVSLSNPGCSPPFVGQASVTGVDGSPPYVYTLDASIIQSNGDFFNLILGNHSILIEDDLGDSFTLNFVIEINNQLEISVFDLSHVACAGQSDGEISVVAFSGVSPFQFSIDGGVTFQSSGSFTNLANGLYQIIGQDASGCFDTISAEIQALSQVNLMAINQENISCFEGANGSVQLIGEFGSNPYQYAMDGGAFQADEVFAGLEAGIHQFLVEDINGCADSISLNFTQADSVELQNLVITNNICFDDNNGEFTFEVIGGTSPYFYQIDGGIESSTPYFDGLSANNYELTINDGNSCLYSFAIQIEEPDSLSIILNDSEIPLCYGGDNGSITFTCSGGLPPYEYSIDGVNWQFTGLFSNLNSDVYTLEVKDQNACTNAIEYTLLDQTELTLSIFNQSNVLCNISTNGSLEVLAVGGVTPYTYSVNGGTYQSSPLFVGLSSGTYTVAVLDYNLCSTSIDVEILETNDLQIDDIIVVDAICGISPEGQLTVVASGGAASYQYSIDGGVNQASNVFLNVTPGLHTIVLTSNDGCNISSSVILSEVSNVGASVLSFIDPTCEGSVDGSIEIVANGGNAPYTYTIDGGLNWQNDGIYTGLLDSAYVFSIQDQFLCTFDTIINFTLQTGLSIDLVTPSPLICPGTNNGSIEIAGQNGTAPYSYSIDDVNYNASSVFSSLSPGDHTFWFQDGIGCNVDTVFTVGSFESPSLITDSLLAPTCSGMSDGVIQVNPGGSTTPYQYSFEGGLFQASAYYTNLFAGTYTIVVEDNNLCQTSVDFTLADVPVFQVSIDSLQDVLCKGGDNGAVFYSFLGGQTPYSISINGGAWQAAGLTIGNLIAGNYNLDFKDANGCIVSLNETIGEPLNDLLPQILSVVNVNCLSDSIGSLFGFASGGTGAYEFTIDGVNYQNSGSFNNLWADSYVFSVLDENGCISNENFSILSNSSVSLVWTSIVLPSCETANNGILSVGVINGSEPFSFQLNNGSSQTGGSFPNLSEGYYSIEVTDSYGCTADIDTVLNSTGSLEISVDSVLNITCMADSSGEIYLNAAGGTPGYTFFIDGLVLAGNNSNGFNSGIYETWVIDAAGCSDSIQVAVQQESLLQGSILSQQNIICNNGNLGSVTVSGITGSSPYVYSIDGFSFNTINTFNDLEAGNYTITIQDATDCIADVDVTIELLTQINLQVQSIVEPTCNGLDNAEVSFEITNGIGPFQYSLNQSALSYNAQFNNLFAGIQTIYAEDSQGCNDSLSFLIGEPASIGILIDSLGLASCFGSDDGYIAVSAVNASGIPDYTLQPDAITNNSGLFNNLDDGIYTVTVVDQNQCSEDSIIEITSPSQGELIISLVNPISCYGDSNAIIDVSVSGGTAPFEYFIDSVSNGNNNFINNLSFGSYVIQVIDDNDCITIDNYSISQPDSIGFNTIQTNNISCFAEDDGFAFFNATGGSGSLEYQLNTSVNSSNGVFTALTPGDYSLQVIDSLLCFIEYDFTILEPSLLEIDTILIQNVICNGDSSASFLISAIGGSPDYSFFVPGIGSFNDSLFENIAEGAYYISVSDQNGCNATQIIVISEPDILTIETQAIVPPLCYNDSTATVLLLATGGNGTLMFGLNENDLGSSAVIQDLPSGMITLYVVDSLGCSNSTSVYIPNAEPMTFESVIQQVSCYGESDGIIQLNGIGGSQSYTYSIDQTNWIDTGIFTGLDTDMYMFYLMDSYGCVEDTTIFLSQPDSLIAIVSSVFPVTCSDQNSGIISVTISGGTEPFESTLNNSTLIGSEIAFEGLSVNSYQITISDLNGCSFYLDTALLEVVGITAYIDPIELNCFGDVNGTASVNYSGGSGSYLFLWDNITEDEFASTETNLMAGVTYSVTVFDSLDLTCSTTAEVTLTQPEQIDFELYSYSSSCDPNDIMINVELISGGVEPFQFSINDELPVESSIFDSLNTVSTQFKVIDVDGCFENEWIIPVNPNIIDAYFEVSDDVVSMGESSIIFTDLSGNTSSLEWDFGDGIIVSGEIGDMAIGAFTTGEISQPEHTYKDFGEFTAKLISFSEFGCEDSYEKVITVKEDHRVYIPNSFTPNNDGVNDVFEAYGSTIEIEGFSMKIFDRGGNVIFQSFDITDGWDGTGKNGVLLRPDVFVYMITFYSGEKFHEKNGSVTLVR